MPSFDFSKYAKKNSLTEFSPIGDLNPQEEWEQRRRSNQQSLTAIRAANSGKLNASSGSSSSSTNTSSLVDAEVNNLLLRTSEQLRQQQRLQSPQTFYTAESRSDVSAAARREGGYSSFRDVIISDFSGEDLLAGEKTMLNENHNRGPNDTYKATPPPSDTPPASEGIPPYTPPVERLQMSGSRLSPRTVPSRPESTSPWTSEVNTPRFQPRPVIMLDENNVLRPIRRTQELQSIIQMADDTSLPNVPPNVDEYIQRYKETPFERVMHYSNTGSYIDRLYQGERLSDVIIRIADKQFAAHRVVLSCYSDYFADLFQKMNEKVRVPVEIRLKGVTTEAFALFLKFAYTGEISIVPELVADVMKMSENLRIATLRSKCLEYMDLLPSNDIVLLIANFKDSQESEIFVRAMKYFNEKFDDVISCDIFLLLDIETLCFLLSYNHLVSCREMDIFKAGLRWIEYKLQERSVYLERILGCIRFTLMTMDELFVCARTIKALTGDDRGQDILLKANWVLTAYILAREDPYQFREYKMRKELQVEPSSGNTPFYSTRAFQPVDIEVGSHRSSVASTPRNENGHAQKPTFTPKPLPPPSLSSVDGTRRGTHTATSRTNKEKDAIVRRESTEQSLESVRSIHHADVKTGDIFAIGDFQKYSTNKQNREVKTIEQYDARDNAWNHVTVLPEPRLHHAITMLDEKLYLVGGTDPRKSKQSSYDFPTKEAFVYDPNTRSWRRIASLNTPRMYHSLCSLDGMIYAIGGQGEHKRILNTVECYNPATDNWFYVKPMSVPRIGACAAELNGRLYVVGGYGSTVDRKSGSDVVSSVECYDPSANRWTRKNDLRFGRCHANLVGVGGNLYLCGGATRAYTMMESVLTSVAVVDVYDEANDVWIPLTQMATPRHNAGCVAVAGRIYMIGGMCSANGQILQSVECYDVVDDVWLNGVTELPYQAQWITCVAVRRS